MEYRHRFGFLIAALVFTVFLFAGLASGGPERDPLHSPIEGAFVPAGYLEQDPLGSLDVLQRWPRDGTVTVSMEQFIGLAPTRTLIYPVELPFGVGVSLNYLGSIDGGTIMHATAVHWAPLWHWLAYRQTIPMMVEIEPPSKVAGFLWESSGPGLRFPLFFSLFWGLLAFLIWEIWAYLENKREKKIAASTLANSLTE